jgi:hypothetical protein
MPKVTRVHHTSTTARAPDTHTFSTTTPLFSTPEYRSTVAALYINRKMRAPIERPTMCEDLLALKRNALRALRRIKQIRRSRDLSFYEDADLTREKHASLHSVLRHLLVGHQGRPCPAGDRPIVNPAAIPRWARPPARPSPRLTAIAAAKVAARAATAQAGAVVAGWPLRLLRFLRNPGMQSSNL